MVLLPAIMFAQQHNPKREFRAAWISTVANIDWPSGPGGSVSSQKQQLITILDYLKEANLNAVVFQIRPACDAMYASEIEPWSFWLTGQQGKAPGSYFDPLEYAIEEAHKRGMELHAWFNPYRVKLSNWTLSLADNNPAVQHPDWVLDVNDDIMLDPGLPAVREHVTNVIMDVVSRYDVDGIHFDDYFYLEGITNEDDETYTNYSRGFTNRGDWRRDNVNELLRMVYAGIQNLKPYVKFGQSPAGIWKNNVPSGINGRDNYSAIYCDGVTWLSEQIIDYLTPQLYWPFGGGQDYGKLMPWWVSVRNGRHIYPGLALYRVGNTGFDETEIGKMVSLNRRTDGAYGEVYFTANDFKDNHLGVTDTLKNNYYKYKAIIPSMDWKDQVAPGDPANLRFDRVAGLGSTAITWDVPVDDDVAWYALYKFSDQNITSEDLIDPANIYDVTSKNYFQIDEDFPSDNNYYVVTALDHNNNESLMSNTLEFQPALISPSVPQLAYPVNNAQDLGDTIIVGWNYAQYAGSYTLQVSFDENFTDLLINISGIVDTSYEVTGQVGETTYFWRVRSENIVGGSDYSESYSFATGFPAAPELLTPSFQEVDVALNPEFTWQVREDAINYQFQLYEGLSIVSNAKVVDTVLSSGSYSSSELNPSTFYSWRVKVTNQLGTSVWSDSHQFKTLAVLPVTPIALSPADGSGNIADSVTLNWGSVKYANQYGLQVGLDENFSELFFNQLVEDTSLTIGSLSGETQYFWRVSASNNSGSGEYSQTNSFTTGFPKVPVAVFPLDQTLEVSITPVISWLGSDIADSYSFQMSEDVSLNLDKLVADTLVTDTSFLSSALKLSTIYTWRVKANNSIGDSEWSEGYRFRTTADTTTDVDDSEIPLDFAVCQNYPNPFNPSTVISFDIPEREFTTVKVFNILGQEVIQLIGSELQAGSYSFDFNSSMIPGGLPSGLYIYVVTSGQKSIIKKMMLLK